ncbi:ATP-grasp domain-containing protein [Streptacidiphilus jiangxiensis]|uniref:Argininosuccinate lyase n=1 Tax=Streptacidiphilus jiangxiensis TaxID=235985 RepID=A0A1H7ZQN1_STRJI|nr:ATP-grasp domain-containing protein [Streptacidiphilus jiangxiensis]SEM59789.1 argininosuccinate lyase [Streptacidiphilus jiangxiensis]
MAAAARLLVLGAGDGHQSAFAAWLRDGLSVTLVDGFSKPRYEFLADRSLPLDVRRADPAHPGHDPALTDRLVSLAAAHDGVVTLSEECASVTPLIAERAGLPHAGVAAAALARDKHRQRVSLEAAGLPVPRYAELASADDLVAFWRATGGGPVVVKPADSGGSASVRILRRAEDAGRAWERAVAYSRSGRCVAEEFVEGPEISVETAVQGGRVVALAVTRKELAGPEFFLERGHAVAPVDELDASAHHAVQQLVDAHGVQNAFLHVEYRLRAGRLVNIEFAARPGGGHIMDLVRRARGWDPYRAVADLALGRPFRQPAPDPAHPYAAVRFLIADGFVRHFAEPAALLTDLPLVESCWQSVREGRALPFPEASWHRAGAALGAAADPGALQEQLRLAVARLADAMGVRELGPRRVHEYPDVSGAAFEDVILAHPGGGR